MYEEDAQKLLDKLIVKANNFAQGSNEQYTIDLLPQVLDKLIIEFDPTAANADLKLGRIFLPIDKYYLERTGAEQDLHFSYVFFHELAHQILPLMKLSQERLEGVFNVFEENRKYGVGQSSEYYVSTNDPNYSLFGNKLVSQFSQALENADIVSNEDLVLPGFVVQTNQEATLLHNYASKMEGIFHEQFADCFSLAMMKNIYPSKYKSFFETLKNSRHNGETYRAKDVEGEGGEVGYVHRVHSAIEAMNETLNKRGKSINTLSDIFDTISPIVEKHILLEMHKVMSDEKTIVYFPRFLEPLISETSNDNKDQAVSKMKRIQDKHLSVNKDSHSNIKEI